MIVRTLTKKIKVNHIIFIGKFANLILMRVHLCYTKNATKEVRTRLANFKLVFVCRE